MNLFMQGRGARRRAVGPVISSWAPRGAGSCLALALAFAWTGCSRPPPVEQPVRAVKVMAVGVSALQAGQEFAGEVRARVESRLGFRVGGKLVQRLAEAGQRVQAGQLLARLDAQDYQLAAQAASAQAAAAQTQRDLAATELQRFQSLKEQGFISGAELDRRRAQLKAAQASFEQARAQQAAQGNQAAYTRLLADAAGVVTAVGAEPGQVVSAGFPVVTLAQDGPRDVVFAVPEQQAQDVRAGQQAQVRVWASQSDLTGTVREVAASADPVTRTFAVKLALPAGGLQPPLGSTVTVRLPQAAAAGRPAIMLPTTALRQQAGVSAVWLLDRTTMTVKSQPVEVAGVQGNQLVIASGLQPGQQVVMTGVHVLTPGQKVKIFEDKRENNGVDTAAGAIENRVNPCPRGLPDAACAPEAAAVSGAARGRAQ